MYSRIKPSQITRTVQDILCTLMIFLFFTTLINAQCGQLLNGGMDGNKDEIPNNWTATLNGAHIDTYDPVTALGGNYSQNGGNVVAFYVDSSDDYAALKTELSDLTIGKSYVLSWQENIIAGYASHAGYTVEIGEERFYFGNLASYAWANRKIKFTANATNLTLSFRFSGAMTSTYLLIDGVELDCTSNYSIAASSLNSSMHGNSGEVPLGWSTVQHSSSIATYDPKTIFGTSYSLDGGSVTAFYTDSKEDKAMLQANLKSLVPGQSYQVNWFVSAVPGYEAVSEYLVTVGKVSKKHRVKAAPKWDQGTLLFTAEGKTETLSFELKGGKGARYLLLDGLNFRIYSSDEVSSEDLNTYTNSEEGEIERD